MDGSHNELDTAKGRLRKLGVKLKKLRGMEHSNTKMKAMKIKSQETE